MLILVFAYLMLECIIAYQIFNSAFAKQMLRCDQMFTCGIPYQMLMCIRTYHMITYDVAYTLLDFDVCHQVLTCDFSYQM